MSGLSLSSEEVSSESNNSSEKSDNNELLIVGVRKVKEKMLRKTSKDTSPSFPFRKKIYNEMTFNNNVTDDSHNKGRKTNTITPHKHQKKSVKSSTFSTTYYWQQ